MKPDTEAYAGEGAVPQQLRLFDEPAAPAPPGAGAGLGLGPNPNPNPSLHCGDCGHDKLLSFLYFMTIEFNVMRCTATWQVVDGIHGDETIGRDGATAAAGGSNALGWQDAGRSSTRSGRGSTDGVHMEGRTG